MQAHSLPEPLSPGPCGFTRLVRDRQLCPLPERTLLVRKVATSPFKHLAQHPLPSPRHFPGSAPTQPPHTHKHHPPSIRTHTPTGLSQTKKLTLQQRSPSPREGAGPARVCVGRATGCFSLHRPACPRGHLGNDTERRSMSRTHGRWGDRSLGSWLALPGLWGALASDAGSLS